MLAQFRLALTKGAPPRGVQSTSGASADQSLRSSRSVWLIRISAIVAGTTTITPPQMRLLRKLEREGVMAEGRLHQSRDDPKDQGLVSTMRP